MRSVTQRLRVSSRSFPEAQCRILRLQAGRRYPFSVRAQSTSAPAGKETVVSPEWLRERLGQPGLKVLDASWFMPAQDLDRGVVSSNASLAEPRFPCAYSLDIEGLNALAEFRLERIPTSQFFDIDGIADLSTGLPHMLPSETQFGAAMDALGVSHDTHVVLYDRLGIFSSPRAWWTFKAFGHERVSVLDGGFPRWKELEYELETAPLTPEQDPQAPVRAAQNPPNSTKYKAALQKDKVRSMVQMLANTLSHKEQVLDARSLGRFLGTEPEPRPGLPSGHIPGSSNLPFPEFLSDGKLKEPSQLAAALKSRGVDLDKPLVVTCGSGLTACTLALGIYELTGKLVPLYDGSWTEYAGTEGTPRKGQAPQSS